MSCHHVIKLALLQTPVTAQRGDLTEPAFVPLCVDEFTYAVRREAITTARDVRILARAYLASRPAEGRRRSRWDGREGDPPRGAGALTSLLSCAHTSAWGPRCMRARACGDSCKRRRSERGGRILDPLAYPVLFFLRVFWSKERTIPKHSSLIILTSEITAMSTLCLNTTCLLGYLLKAPPFRARTINWDKYHNKSLKSLLKVPPFCPQYQLHGLVLS